MTQRLIVGRHPLNGNYGLWLSKPGIDATTTVDPNNFLIAPGVKNEMVMLAGIAAHGSTIFFPEVLSDKPIVYYSPTNAAGVDFYPFPTNVATKFGGTQCVVTTSYMQFFDNSGNGLSFNYIVVNRSLL